MRNPYRIGYLLPTSNNLHNMKLAILACLVFGVALVTCEQCTTDADCVHEACDGDTWKVSCNLHPLIGAIGQQGTCTCVQDGHTGAPCNDASECSISCPTLLHEECLNNHCHCTFSLGGIGGIGGIGK